MYCCIQIKREAQEAEIRALEQQIDEEAAVHNDSASIQHCNMCGVILAAEMMALKAALLDDKLSFQRDTSTMMRQLESRAKTVRVLFWCVVASSCFVRKRPRRWARSRSRSRQTTKSFDKSCLNSSVATKLSSNARLHLKHSSGYVFLVCQSM